MLTKVFNILFYIFIALIPTGQLLRFKVVNNVNIVPQDLIVFLLFIISVYIFIKKKFIPKDSLFVLAYLLFICVGTVSLVINSFFNPSYNFLVSLLYGVRLTVYLSIFIYPLILKDKARVNNLIFLAGSIIVLIGIFQYLYYNDLSFLRYLGWDSHLYRLFSTFLDPNFAGIFYVVFLGFVAARIHNIFRIKTPSFEIFILIMTIISIYLTYSRSAFLAFIVFALVVFILQKKFLRIVIFVPMLLVLYFLFSDKMVEGLNPFRTFSSNQRIVSFKNAFDIFSKNPIFGVGYNSFRYALIKYEYVSEIGAATSNSDAGTDNSLLFTLTTTGIIGFFFFSVGYFTLLKKLYLERTFESSIYFAVVLSVFFGSLFVNALFYIPIISFLFLILAFRSES